MIYLDYASSTPISQSVFNAMEPFYNNKNFHYINPNSSYKIGKDLYKFIDLSRVNIAKLINAYSPSEIIFTSGATESNNIAILGSTIFSEKEKKRNHIITTKIEHVSVLKCFQFLEKKGYKVSYLSVNKYGLIDLNELSSLITNETSFVSIMHVNNEMGAVQNIEEISNLLANKNIVFHVDAAQSFGKLKIDLQNLNIDLLSISGHKIYGPKGIGALYTRLFPIKNNINPIMFGSGNERGLRPGTPFLPQIVGLGQASLDAFENYEKNTIHLKSLKQYFFLQKKKKKNIILNGSIENIIPGIINIQVQNKNKNYLDKLQSKFLFSFGSSCSKNNMSHVLKAMNLKEYEIKTSIRLSFGIKTKEKDLLNLLNII